MDAFAQSAQDGRMRQTLVIGATFGIFLTMGNAWSAFLEAAVRAIMPVRADETEGSIAIRELLFASLASFICLTLLVTIIKCDNYATKAGKALSADNVKRLAKTIPGMTIVRRPVQDTEVPKVVLMGNTKHSVTRRMRLTRHKVRQGGL